MVRMKRSAAATLAALIFLVSCGGQKADGCRQHTGDGLCADEDKQPDGKPLP